MQKNFAFVEFNKNINLSTKFLVLNQVKNHQLKTSYSSLQYILLKMTINVPLKWKISTRAVTLFWDPFWRQVRNIDLPSNLFKIFFAYKLCYKKFKSVKHRVIRSFFRRHQIIRDRGIPTCTPPIWIGLNECDNSYARWVLSSVIIITQSDTRNIEYVIGWVKK